MSDTPTFRGPQSRREFLKRAGMVTAAGAAGGWALDLAGMSGASVAGAQTPGYRAIVCVFLYGGNDHHDTVVAYDPASYATYSSLRGTIARPRDTLIPLASDVADPNGRQVAFTPQWSNLAGLFNTGKLAVLSNVGPLREPLDRDTYFAQPSKRPPQLFSHNDQQSIWQATVGEGATSGWGGRIGDLVMDTNAGDSVFTCISASGNAVMLTGRDAVQLQVSSSGVTKLRSTFSSSAVLGGLEQVLRSQTSPGMFDATYSTITNRALDVADRLDGAVTTAGSPGVTFPTSSLGKQLAMVSRLINAGRNTLGVKRQVFFVSTGGFDNHDSLATVHPGLLSDIDASLFAFQSEIDRLGVGDDVITFTGSDFGRTLTINGDGSDHAWGAHHVIMGGPVRGKTVYGALPELGVNTADDVGSGRLIPKVAVDQYASTLATWMGVSQSDMGLVVPNIDRFASADLGFAPAATTPTTTSPTTTSPTTSVPVTTTVVVPPPSTNPPPSPPPVKVGVTGGLRALTPARVVDTRVGLGAAKRRLGPGSVTYLTLAGKGGVPETGVAAVVVNIATVNASAPTYLSFAPTAPLSTPSTSTVNVVPGRARANGTILPVSSSGTVTVYNHSGELDVIVDVTGYVTSAASTEPAARFTALTPVRVCDTRRGLGLPAGMLVPDGVSTLKVAGLAGVPADAAAVALNVTVVAPDAAGFLTVWPAGQPRQEVSTINYVAGEVVANMMVAKPGSGGAVHVFTNAARHHLVVDVTGFYSADGAVFTPITPARLVDSRIGLGVARSKLGAGDTWKILVAGSGGIARDASAALLNVVSVSPSQPSFFTVHPSGSSRPDTSTLNVTAGAAVANSTIAKLGDDGAVMLYNYAGVGDVVVDSYGYFR